MYNYSVIAQIIVALGVGFVWVFRLDNIIKEFKEYGINDQTRTFVGASKIILATLLVVGIWYPTVWLVLIPALLMAFLMLSAQYFHFKAKNASPTRPTAKGAASMPDHTGRPRLWHRYTV